MSNVTVQEALKAAVEALEDAGTHTVFSYEATINECKAALSEIDMCEPVAEAIRERDRLGFAVVNVIGKLDEIIENTQEVEIDDFLNIAVPIDMWNELQAALEDMPKRADLYTSPQPIEKCEPVPPIEYDADMDRFYIPMVGGWEIQTKGKGSTFRICNTKTHVRWPVLDEHLHEALEQMAKDNRQQLNTKG